MEKEIRKIINWIKKEYENLPKSKIEDKELIIFATGDFVGEYGYGSSDLESWGVDRDGKLYWAYASGCSCYCSAGVEEKTMKIFQVDIPKELERTNLLEAIGLFTTDKERFRASLQSYEYKSW